MNVAPPPHTHTQALKQHHLPLENPKVTEGIQLDLGARDAVLGKLAKLVWDPCKRRGKCAGPSELPWHILALKRHIIDINGVMVMNMQEKDAGPTLR